MIPEKPLVSIIIPVYNVHTYLEECVKSLLSQTYKNIEIILVDDGSTDGSAQLVDSLAVHDPRIHVLHQENAGPSAARNNGIDHAKGEYISFVDGDDSVSSDYVSYLLSLQQHADAPMALSKNCFTTANHHQVDIASMECMSGADAAALLFYPDVALGAWDKLYSKSFLLRNGIRFNEDFRAGEGLLFIVSCALHSDKVMVGNRKVYCYRTNNSQSATTKPDVKTQGEGAIRTMQYIATHVDLHDSAVRRAYEWRLWSTYGYCLKQIIASHAQHLYHELYRQCILYRRRHALSQLKAHISLRNKIYALLTALSPTIVARLSLRRKA